MKKVGLYSLTKPKEIANDWIIILDESVEFGKHKLLVIYGVRASQIDFTRPLRFNDIIPLREVSKDKWDADEIKILLDELKKELGNIIYAVADNGNSIRKSLELASIPHVYDITHKIAWILRNMYAKDEDYMKYTKILAKMRGTMCLSKISHILPPKLAVKSRFMNLKPIANWGNSALEYLSGENHSNSKEYEALKWVKEFDAFIKEILCLNQIIEKVETILKNNGLTLKTLQDCMHVFKTQQGKNKRVDSFIESLKEYLINTKQLLSKEEKVLCTSDIIESSFGKYKNYLSKNQMIGITNLSLCISAFTSNIENSDIKNAMEQIQVKDIEKWTKSNIGRTLLSERKTILRKTG